jgi:hypothetical protein
MSGINTHPRSRNGRLVIGFELAFSGNQSKRLTIAETARSVRFRPRVIRFFKKLETKGQTNMNNLGLFEGRHEMPVDGYIFASEETSVFGFHQKLYDEARRRGKALAEEYGSFNFYATGLTVAALGVIDGAHDAGITLGVMNYDKESDSYMPISRKVPQEPGTLGIGGPATHVSVHANGDNMEFTAWGGFGLGICTRNEAAADAWRIVMASG